MHVAMEKEEKQSITIVFKEDENGKMVAYIKDMNFKCRAVDLSILDNTVQKVADIINNIKL